MIEIDRCSMRASIWIPSELGSGVPCYIFRTEGQFVQEDNYSDRQGTRLRSFINNFKGPVGAAWIIYPSVGAAWLFVTVLGLR